MFIELTEVGFVIPFIFHLFFLSRVVGGKSKTGTILTDLCLEDGGSGDGWCVCEF